MNLAASFIMPTRNRAEVLRLSLPRLLRQTVPASDYEIVVVDDASDDDTADVVASMAAPNMVYRRQAERGAAAAARNRAIGVARGEILVFVDDDALVRSDFLAQHLAPHRARRGLVVAGPIIECTEPPAAENPAPGFFLGRHSNPFPTGNASVAKSAVVEAGGFDEGFRAYGWEDPEMYRRLLRTGVRRRYNWRAPIWHYKPAAYRRDFFQRLALEESRGAMGAYYYSKHPTLSVAFETKQLGLFQALDRALAPALRLDQRIEDARRTGIEPGSALWRLLMINHTEIAAGRAMREKLDREAGARDTGASGGGK